MAETTPCPTCDGLGLFPGKRHASKKGRRVTWTFALDGSNDCPTCHGTGTATRYGHDGHTSASAALQPREDR